MKKKKRAFRGSLYLYVMLVIFWPASVYEYIREGRYMKKLGRKRDYITRVVYTTCAWTAGIMMTAAWYVMYVFFRYYAFK